MGRTKHRQNQSGGSESDSVGFHRPYWRSAHRDWRLWIAVGLMFVAMLTYIMSDNLAWRPRSQPQQPLSGAAKN
jgi:hypothetical protein